MFCPRTVLANVAAIASSPTMQATIGKPDGSAGHSANLAKLKRSAAFTSTSDATSAPLPAAIPVADVTVAASAMTVVATAMLAASGHPARTPRVDIYRDGHR